MQLKLGHHLAYCTNVHRGENWEDTFKSLNQNTLGVRDQVVRDNAPYAIGLRLSALAAKELLEGQRLQSFQEWLKQNDCYIFTINGFPYGQFHGARVKEQVYAPDWTDPARLEYTMDLFRILDQLAPKHLPISVSTLPGSFKEFIQSPDQETAIFDNIWKLVDFLSELKASSGRSDISLGLEPEPLGWFENTEETIRFFDRLQDHRPGDGKWKSVIGVNYDTCHFALEYEDAAESLAKFHSLGIRISKIHLSAAFSLRPGNDDSLSLNSLRAFSEDTYLHQVIARFKDGGLMRFKDLQPALDSKEAASAEEWRVHFHIPLHSPGNNGLVPTSDHTLATLDFLTANPGLCTHLEMETYTWEVMPEDMKSTTVIDQLAKEYEWTLAQLRSRGLA